MERKYRRSRKVKAYKIIFEDEIGAGELVEIAYSIHIPENLEPKKHRKQ